MGKQPYIPFYVGDYLKDTRILPLAVRGAWVDLILFMWDSPVRGEIVGTIEDFARLMSCDRSEAQFALDLLKQKKTADFELLSTGEIKITARKMKRDAEISKKRSEAGKNGVEAKKGKAFAEAKTKAKREQNTEYENENEYDINTTTVVDRKVIEDAIFTDEIFMYELNRMHQGKNFRKAWDECYLFHSNRPTKLNTWEWRQKFSTWLIKYKETSKASKFTE